MSELQWNVYLERADNNQPAQFIGTIGAESQEQALIKASQFYEIPAHDLVVECYVYEILAKEEL